MSVSSRLIFDVTDAATQAASANVGAWVRAGSDGELIESTSNALHVLLTNASIAVTATDLDIRNLVFATDTLDVSGSSVELGATTLAALENITVSGTDIDIRNLVFATDKVDVSGSSVELGATSLAALENITVSATDLDIRNLAAATDAVSAWTKDGSGNAITSTTGWLDVNIAGGSLTVSDAALADIAGSNAAISVSTSGALAASVLADRKYLYAYNNGSKAVYLGFGTVTAANGFPMYPGVAMEMRAGDSIAMNAFAVSAQDVRIMQLS